jgi:hypothetical protein
MSTLFWLNGAGRCIAIDMAGLQDQSAAASSLGQLLHDCRNDVPKWLMPGSSPEIFLDRLAQLDTSHLEAGRLYQCVSRAPLVHIVGRIEEALRESGSVDIVVSATVLEHVADLSGVVSHFKKLLSRDGAMYHNIDYSDHGVHVDSSLNYWSFMTEGHEVPDIKDGGDINKLRNSEVEKIFRDAGFALDMDPLFRQTPPEQVVHSLLPQYRRQSKDDLELVSTGLFLRHA